MFAKKENKVIQKNLEDRKQSFWKQNDEKKIAKKVGPKLFLERKIGSKSYTRRRKLKQKKEKLCITWVIWSLRSLSFLCRPIRLLSNLCLPLFWPSFLLFYPCDLWVHFASFTFGFFGCRTDIKLPFLLIASISFCLLPFELCPLSRSARWGDFRVSPFRFDLLPFDFLFAVFCCVL